MVYISFENIWIINIVQITLICRKIESQSFQQSKKMYAEESCSNFFVIRRMVPFMYFIFNNQDGLPFFQSAKSDLKKVNDVDGSENYKISNSASRQNAAAAVTKEESNGPSVDYLWKFHVDHKIAKMNYELRQSSSNATLNWHNGEIDNMSQLSKTQATASKSSSFKISPKAKKILIVDDAYLNRKMLGKLLTQKGHYCEEARNGIIGLNMVKATIDMTTDDLLHKCYDVIIMDIMMPEMNGIEATKEIRQLGFKGPIIGITASVDPKDEDAMLKEGATTVLIKPFKTKDVYAIVDL